MFFWNKICATVFFLFITVISCAQTTKNPVITIKYIIPQNSFNGDTLIHLKNVPSLLSNMQAINHPISQDFYTRNFGFFCKQELIIEKATKLPLRFRLGSLQQCNYYEGKR